MAEIESYHPADAEGFSADGSLLKDMHNGGLFNGELETAAEMGPVAIQEMAEQGDMTIAEAKKIQDTRSKTADRLVEGTGPPRNRKMGGAKVGYIRDETGPNAGELRPFLEITPEQYKTIRDEMIKDFGKRLDEIARSERQPEPTPEEEPPAPEGAPEPSEPEQPVIGPGPIEQPTPEEEPPVPPETEEPTPPVEVTPPIEEEPPAPIEAEPVPEPTPEEEPPVPPETEEPTPPVEVVPPIEAEPVPEEEPEPEVMVPAEIEAELAERWRDVEEKRRAWLEIEHRKGRWTTVLWSIAEERDLVAAREDYAMAYDQYNIQRASYEMGAAVDQLRRDGRTVDFGYSTLDFVARTTGETDEAYRRRVEAYVPTRAQGETDEQFSARENIERGAVRDWQDECTRLDRAREDFTSSPEFLALERRVAEQAVRRQSEEMAIVENRIAELDNRGIVGRVSNFVRRNPGIAIIAAASLVTLGVAAVAPVATTALFIAARGISVAALAGGASNAIQERAYRRGEGVLRKREQRDIVGEVENLDALEGVNYEIRGRNRVREDRIRFEERSIEDLGRERVIQERIINDRRAEEIREVETKRDEVITRLEGELTILEGELENQRTRRAEAVAAGVAFDETDLGRYEAQVERHRRNIERETRSAATEIEGINRREDEEIERLNRNMEDEISRRNATITSNRSEMETEGNIEYRNSAVGGSSPEDAVGLLAAQVAFHGRRGVGRDGQCGLRIRPEDAEDARTYAEVADDYETQVENHLLQRFRAERNADRNASFETMLTRVLTSSRGVTYLDRATAISRRHEREKGVSTMIGGNNALAALAAGIGTEVLSGVAAISII